MYIICVYLKLETFLKYSICFNFLITLIFIAFLTCFWIIGKLFQCSIFRKHKKNCKKQSFLSRISALVTDRVVPKKPLDNDWESATPSSITSFWKKSKIASRSLFFRFYAHSNRKTSKRAIPLSPWVLPNNCVLLRKTISHSSKCLTLTFVYLL